MMMSNIINKAFLAGLGAVSLGRDKVEGLIDELVKRGELSQEEKQGMLSELLESVEKRQAELEEFIHKEIQQILKSLDIPTREEMNRLKEEIDSLRKQDTDREDN
ncbi:MAG: phasin family protein [candidate division Zixibacteria bacterium]|nr:phasin family protein [candidate division Zixibacteria bacterium]